MSNITPGHVRVFQAVRSQLYDNITLTSCTINGKPDVAIVMVDEVGETKSPSCRCPFADQPIE